MAIIKRITTYTASGTGSILSSNPPSRANINIKVPLGTVYTISTAPTPTAPLVPDPLLTSYGLSSSKFFCAVSIINITITTYTGPVTVLLVAT